MRVLVKAKSDSGLSRMFNFVLPFNMIYFALENSQVMIKKQTLKGLKESR